MGEFISEAPIEIQQGQVIRGVTGDTMLKDNMGDCVLGIAHVAETGTFIAGHFQAGEIVYELKALAKIGGGTVSVTQTKVEASIKEIYESGQHLTAQQARRMFRDTDRTRLGIVGR